MIDLVRLHNNMKLLFEKKKAPNIFVPFNNLMEHVRQSKSRQNDKKYACLITVNFEKIQHDVNPDSHHSQGGLEICHTNFTST